MSAATHRQFDELVAAWCTGTIDDAGFAALEDLLARDPGARRRFVEHCHGEMTLYYHFAGETRLTRHPLPAASDRRQAGQRPPRRRARHARHHRPRTTPWLLLAAGLLVAVGLTLLATLARDPAPARQLPGRLGVHAGAPVTAGATLTSQAIASTVAWHHGDARIELAPHTRLMASAADRLRLEQGRIRCVVPGLAAGERLQVVTPAATITVLGTVFTVAHAAEATTVSVEEGRVQVRTSAGASRVLGAGEAFRSDAGSQPHPPPTDGWALLRHDREATTVLDHVRENGTLVLPADTQLVLEVEVPAGVRAITATLDGEELVMRSRTSDGRRVEKVPPYFLFGNQEDRHYARELEPGRRKLEVTGWADADATRVHDRAVFTLEIEPAAPAEATDRTTTTAPATPPARR